jgi:DnaJ-class molecular chaperone
MNSRPQAPDYYQILGVSYDDPLPKIRARYRLLVLTRHPDVSAEHDPFEFSTYAEAYKILKNPESRRKYNAELGLRIEARSLRPGYDLHQRLILTHDIAREGGIFPLTFRRDEPCRLCWCVGCFRCNGAGLHTTHVTVDVRVPPNTTQARTVFIAGYGGISEPGGTRGDLLVHLTLTDQP